MGLPICDTCAQKELGDFYDVIDKNYKFSFGADCTVCGTGDDGLYCIPEYSRENETGLDTIKKFLKKEACYNVKQVALREAVAWCFLKKVTICFCEQPKMSTLISYVEKGKTYGLTAEGECIVGVVERLKNDLMVREGK